MEHWDDIRYFLALAREGTSRAAARSLGVHQSTISRRLAQLEQGAGVRLFDRQPRGLQLTEAGERLIAAAERMEAEVAAVDRQLFGLDGRLSGRVRISLPDLMLGPLAPHLVAFSTRYPGIALEVVSDNTYVNLTQRDADVAIRLGARAPDHLVGRRIGPAVAAPYGSHAYLAAHPDHGLAEMDWIRWDEHWRDIAPERWIDEHIPPNKIRARVNINSAMVELASNGLGVGFQLCYTGDAEPRLARVGAPTDFGLSIWVLTHPDLRRTARVRAFTRFITDALDDERDRIEGRLSPT